MAVGHIPKGYHSVNTVLIVEDGAGRNAIEFYKRVFGAEMLFPVEDLFYGDRSGRIKDPFGHVWIVSTHKEDVPVAEIERRAAALYG